MNRKIKVASVQFESVPGDKGRNLSKIQSFVEAAAEQSVEIIAFPECCITGYWFMRHLSRDQMISLAEPLFDGPSCQFLMGLSKRHNMTIGAGLIEIAPDGRIYKPYVVAMPDGTFQRHRKLHPFVNENIECGNEYTVFDTPHGCRIGVLICYDNNIIENARINAIRGAQILLAPHQTGGCRTNNTNVMGVVDREVWDNRFINPEEIERELKGPKGREWLMRWLPSRAHDNGMYVIFSNGVGVDDDEIRTGNSMIIDPYGRIAAETWKAGDDMVIADIDLSIIPGSTGRGWLITRRPEIYGELSRPTGMEKSTREVVLSRKGQDGMGLKTPLARPLDDK
ncbi:MAG TPA: nitrilase family protein [Clostridia bacterium]|nr:nitrilase family protein [Clostridia bacterium]